MARYALLAVVLCLAGCADAAAPDDERTGRVARVSDGDTLRLRDGRRVRLVQIDAPEAGAECWGASATDALRRLAPPGAAVELERDPALDDTDRFGRLLRYVRIGDVNVNVELVRRGAAAPYFFGGVRGRYADALLDAARAARASSRGLWGGCPGTRLDAERAVATGSR